ncbi:MAG: S8/S53 family peptidase [Deinococcales bacterium]
MASSCCACVAIKLNGLGNPNGISGTSFAAPIVSAVAALSLEKYPQLSGTALMYHIYDNSPRVRDFKLVRLPR